MSKLNPTLLTKNDIEEVASFLNLDAQQCKEKIINYDNKELAQSWDKVNPVTPEEIRQFYATKDFYIFELTQANRSLERSNYHGKIVEYILKAFPANTHPEVLDYGSGVGEELITFGGRGYKVSFADIPGKTSDFVKYRLARRNVAAEYIPIVNEVAKLSTKYDIIICFDVLEHVPNPVRVLSCLSQHLSSDGIITIVNCPSNGGDHPCHLSSTFSVLGRLWTQTLDRVGLIPVKGHGNLYKKAPFRKMVINKLKYLIWETTSYYIMRVPKHI